MKGDDGSVISPSPTAAATVTVAYRGILPDLFREGQGVVTEGVVDPDGNFTADTVLAKHDENYMPKEVADALKKQGVWRHSEDGAPQPGRRNRVRCDGDRDISLAVYGVPLAKAEDVKTLTRTPGVLSGEGRRSAFEAANSWFDANDIPPSFRAVLSKRIAAGPRPTLVKATFEQQTPLDGLVGRARRTCSAIVRLKIPVPRNSRRGGEGQRDLRPDGRHLARRSARTESITRLAGLAARLEIDAGHHRAASLPALSPERRGADRGRGRRAKDAALVIAVLRRRLRSAPASTTSRPSPTALGAPVH